MSQQIINLGTADKGNGDVLRTAFTKVNENFAELYNSVSAVVVASATAPAGPGVGDLWWNSEDGRMYVYYGTAWVDASPVDGAGISSTNQLVNGAYTLSLGANGALTFPDTTLQTTAWTGSVSSLVNGNAEVILENDGEITSVLFPTRGTGKIFLSGSEIGTTPADEGTYSAPLVLSSFSNDVKISANGIGPVNPVWQFKTDGTLTLPPQDTTLTNVNQIVTAKIYRATDSTNATAIRAAKFNWVGVEQTFTDIRDQDAQLIAGGGYTRPWTGMPSWEALPLITTYQPTGSQLPVPGGLAPAANNAKNAYLAWKELVSNIDIVSGDKTFSFENTGELRVPGVITSDDLMRLNSVATASTNNASVIAEGDGGIVFIKTGDGISIDNTWTFGADGQLTLPADGVINSDDSLHVYVFDSNVATLESTYDQKVIELDAAFAAESWTGAGYPAGPTSSQALNIAKALNPLIPDAWITIANGLQDAYDAWQAALNGKHWTFGTDGELSLPNNAVIRTDGNNVEVGNVTNFNVEAEGVVNIYTDTNGVTPFQWQFGDDGAITFPDGTTTTGESITLPVNQSLTVTVSHDEPPPGHTNTFKINPESIKLPTGNGTIFSGTETAANAWHLDSANKTLYFPDAGDGVFPQIKYSTTGNDGMQLLTAAKPIKITVESNTHWTFGTDGALTLPDASVIASYKPVTVIAATTTAQTITDNASAAFIQFVDTVDTASAYSTGTFTAPYTGYYQINMSVYFSTTVTLNSGSFLLIDTNLDFTKQVRIIDGNWTGSYLHYSTVISATAGDAIRVAFRQVSGGDIDVSSGSRLTIHRVSIS